MAQARLPRMTDQYHQAHPRQCPHENVGQFTEVVLVEEKRRGDGNHDQRDIPKSVPPVLEEPDVVVVGRFEMNAHDRQTFFC